MHEVLVNRLGGLSLPRKSVVRLTDRPDMTLDVYRGRKTTNQQHLESAEGETKVCGRTRYRIRDLWLLSQMRYRLPYAAWPTRTQISLLGFEHFSRFTLYQYS